jgi:electron transfer flavoprotein beta subunit
VELAIFGKHAIDGDSGLVPVSVACTLGWTSLSYVAEVYGVDVQNARISVARLMEEGRQNCSGALPAIISVVKEINEPRYPSFVGIRKASKSEIPVWDLAKLELDVADVKDGNSAVTWADIRPLPASGGAVELIEGESMEDIAATLADRLMADKVI